MVLTQQNEAREWGGRRVVRTECTDTCTMTQILQPIVPFNLGTYSTISNTERIKANKTLGWQAIGSTSSGDEMNVEEAALGRILASWRQARRTCSRAYKYVWVILILILFPLVLFELYQTHAECCPSCFGAIGSWSFGP